MYDLHVLQVARAKQAAVRPLPSALSAQPKERPVEAPGSPVTQGGDLTDSDSPVSGLEDNWPPQGMPQQANAEIHCALG